MPAMSKSYQQLWKSSPATLEADSILEDLDSLAVRRELAAASVAALGDFWDNELDAQWQNFRTSITSPRTK